MCAGPRLGRADRAKAAVGEGVVAASRLQAMCQARMQADAWMRGWAVVWCGVVWCGAALEVNWPAANQKPRVTRTPPDFFLTDKTPLTHTHTHTHTHRVPYTTCTYSTVPAARHGTLLIPSTMYRHTSNTACGPRRPLPCTAPAACTHVCLSSPHTHFFFLAAQPLATETCRVPSQQLSDTGSAGLCSRLPSVLVHLA